MVRMGRIMVVENERIELRTTLTRLGYEVGATAATSDDALRLVDDHPPDLIVMDVRIQGDRDGIATAALLRARGTIPIVFVSGPADGETLARAAEVEHDGFLVEPVSDDQLRTTVELALRKREVRAFEAEEDTAVKTVPERCLLVGATDPEIARRAALDADPLIARSPLDMIGLVETHGHAIRTIVLVEPGGCSVTNAQLAQFIEATYPWVRVVTR